MIIKIPAWATQATVLTNGIDGYPPFETQRFHSIEALNAAIETLRKDASGGGEWNVFVYVQEAHRVRVLYPFRCKYSPEHPEARLGSAGPGNRVKLVAQWDYMCPLASEAAKKVFWHSGVEHVREPKVVRFVRSRS